MSGYGLTPRQAELLRFIGQSIARRGYAPSLAEMRDHLGITSTSSVHSSLKGLEDRGRIRRLPNRARAIEVLQPLAPSEPGQPAIKARPPCIVNAPTTPAFLQLRGRID